MERLIDRDINGINRYKYIVNGRINILKGY